MDVFLWAVIFVAFVIAEIITVQLVSIWFAAGALVTIFCAYFLEIGLLGQLGVFILVSTVCLAASLPFLKKRNNKAFIGTNAELDVGKNAVVIEEIDQDNGTGRVTLSGVDWKAVPAEQGSVIPVGSIVTVREVRGAKLAVSLKK